jgi:hypothetical protein
MHKKRSVSKFKESLGIENKNIKLLQATEPTNIIWENQSVTKKHRIPKFLLGVTLLVLIFAVDFGLSLYLYDA